jgi:hypothetical protein
MTNHPNRNWRAQARQAAESAMQDHSVLHEAPLRPGGDGLRNRLIEAFLLGFAAGREQNKPRPK